MKKRFYFLMSMALVCLLACENSNYDSFDEHVPISGILLNSPLLVDTTHYYALNVIPDWVRDSLTPEGFETIKELSRYYRIRYRMLTEEERMNNSLNNLELKDTSVAFQENFFPSRLKTSREGPDIDQGYNYVSYIDVVDSWMSGPARMKVNAYHSCLLNRNKKDFNDVTLRVDLVGNGLIFGTKRWVDGGSRADKSGDRIQYVVIGTAEIFQTVEGIGTDLSRDVNQRGSLSPYEW